MTQVKVQYLASLADTARTVEATVKTDAVHPGCLDRAVPVHRSPGGPLKLHGACWTYESSGGMAQAVDATVRDGDAVSQPGRAQALAREQRFEYLTSADAQGVLK